MGCQLRRFTHWHGVMGTAIGLAAIVVLTGVLMWAQEADILRGSDLGLLVALALLFVLAGALVGFERLIKTEGRSCHLCVKRRACRSGHTGMALGRYFLALSIVALVIYLALAPKWTWPAFVGRLAELWALYPWPSLIGFLLAMVAVGMLAGLIGIAAYKDELEYQRSKKS